jgi:hypothetical protein
MDAMAKVKELETTMESSSEVVKKDLYAVKQLKLLGAEKLKKLCVLVQKRNVLKRKKEFLGTHLYTISHLQKDIECSMNTNMYEAMKKINEAKSYMKHVKQENGNSTKLNCLLNYYELLEVY